jgi:chromosomal replication initiation ATPase DnaA
MSFRELGKIISVKDEPQTTPSLAQLITKAKARETVDNYKITPALRDHFKRVLECAVHRKGQGFWVQAEYGAGKTHFLGTLVDLLI